MDAEKPNLNENPFTVGDSVTLVDGSETGIVLKVERDDVWVDTDCNIYRGYHWTNFRHVSR